MTEAAEEDVLDLQEDVYCLTFQQMILVDDSVWHRQLVLKSVFTFIIQVALIYIILVTTDGVGSVFTGDVYLNCARLMCAILLHMSVMPEVRTAVDMMRFALTNPKKFKGKRNYIPYLIAVMKLVGGFSTEVINLFKMAQSTTVGDIVKDFIAFGIIAEIDDLIVLTIKGVDIEAIMTSSELNISYNDEESKLTLKDLKNNIDYTSIAGVANSLAQFVFFIVYKFTKFIYIGIYFYFAPLVIILLVSLMGDG